MNNDIAIGEIVTWGSGAPRAEVVLLSTITGDAALVLSQDLKSPCGRVFLKGMRLTMPINELRRLV
jgi:hypothetical protein